MTPAAPPAPPAAVVFDNDGLTLDSETVWTRAEELLFAAHGRTFTAEHKLALVGRSGAQAAAILERLLELPAGEGPAELERLNGLVVEELRAHGCTAMPGAEALLRALRARGARLALCSNSPRAIVDAALDAAGLRALFDATIAGGETTGRKPDPDPYLAAATRLGIEPRACVALEDSPTGCRSARAAGMLVIGVPSVPGVSLDGEADLTFSSLLEPGLWRALGVAPRPA